MDAMDNIDAITYFETLADALVRVSRLASESWRECPRLRPVEMSEYPDCSIILYISPNTGLQRLSLVIVEPRTGFTSHDPDVPLKSAILLKMLSTRGPWRVSKQTGISSSFQPVGNGWREDSN